MYILKNAYANLFRNKGRTIMIMMVMVLIIFLSAIAILLQQSSQQMMELIKQRDGSEVFISVNRMDEASSKAKALDAHMIQQIQNNKLIKDCDIKAQVIYDTVSFQVLDDQINSNRKGNLIASSQKDIDDSFKKGMRKLMEGRKYQKKGEVIVSKKLAEKNNWHLSQKIIIKDDEQTSISLIITGIYDDLSMQAYQSSNQMPSSNPGNDIFTSIETLIDTYVYQNTGWTEIRLHLHHYQDVNALKNTLKQMGLPSYYSVRTNDIMMKENLKPVQQMNEIAEKLMLGVFVVGGTIFVLICFMSIRERIYEIGVLRAMGMKKIKIAYGIFFEYLMMSMISLLFALFLANMSADKIAHRILSASNISIHLQASSMIEIIALTFSLIILSSSIAIFYITRFEPAKILRQS